MNVFYSGLDPVILIEPEHEPGLIIKFLVSARNRNLCREVSRLPHESQVPVVADEAVMGFTPEIRLVAGCDNETIVFAPPMRRLVEPFHVFP